MQGNKHRTGSNETTPKKSQNQAAKLPGFAETGAPLETSPLNYQFGEFTLDVARGCVFKGERRSSFAPRYMKPSNTWWNTPGRLIGKQELMQAVWPDAFVTDDSLVQCTLELRRALDDRSQQLLKTVPRRGYLFTAPVIQALVEARIISLTPVPLIWPMTVSWPRPRLSGSAAICLYRALRSSDENSKWRKPRSCCSGRTFGC